MRTVRVDFNMIVRDSLVMASPLFASEVLHVNDRVDVVDFADPDMSFVGVVEDIDDNGFAYLRMEWEPVPAEDPAEFWSPITLISSADPPTGGRHVRSEDLILSAAG